MPFHFWTDVLKIISIAAIFREKRLLNQTCSMQTVCLCGHARTAMRNYWQTRRSNLWQQAQSGSIILTPNGVTDITFIGKTLPAAMLRQ